MAPRDALRRGALRLTLIALVLAGLAVFVVLGSAPASTNLCHATGVGRTPQAAIRSYLSQCGADYEIERDSHPLKQPASGYTETLEYSLVVKNNPQHNWESVFVGRPSTGGPWTTVEPGSVR